jgi:hypothetical protein
MKKIITIFKNGKRFMKKIIAIFISTAALLVIGCAPNQPVPVQSAADEVQLAGSLRLNMANGDDDSAVALAKKIPGREKENDSVEQIWLTIKEVQVHVAGDTSEKGWKTVAEPNKQVNFLKLVNGVTEPLDIYPLPAGKYTQIRLILAQTEGDNAAAGANTIVVNGETFPIAIPSAFTTGIKCVHNFTVARHEVTEICLRFDVLKAVHYAPGNGYMMKPAYRTYKCESFEYVPYR